MKKGFVGPLRSKSTLAQSMLKKSPINELEESIHFDFKREQSNVNSVNNIVDINVISNSSKLASHYLYESKSRLGDMNLNEVWPASSMYKVTIKENPWVSSFKARSQANEINSSFRDNFDSNLSFSRLHSTGPKVKTPLQTNFFPNIKNLL